MTVSRDPFPRMVPILRPDGTPVTEFVSAEQWQDLKFGRQTAQEVNPKKIVQEEHHCAYGRPWILGRYYFDHLTSRGVRPSDRVLDLGCGSGRLGVWLTAFLEPRRYFGIDHHLAALVAFAGYECALHDLFDKQPSLMLDGGFNFERFGVQFDVVLDLFTSVHVELEAREDLFRRLAAVCAPGGRLFSPRRPKLPRRSTLLADVGFELVHVEEVRYPILVELGMDEAAGDTWHEYRRR